MTPTSSASSPALAPDLDPNLFQNIANEDTVFYKAVNALCTYVLVDDIQDQGVLSAVII